MIFDLALGMNVYSLKKKVNSDDVGLKKRLHTP
jgi:hypothetical protein